MQRQRCGFLGRHDVVGMQHLKPRSEALDAAADDPPAARGKGAREIIGVRMEIDQLDHRRAVRAANAIRLSRIPRRHVIEHVDGDGCDSTRFGACEGGAVRTVDNADGKIEGQIDKPRARDARYQLCDLWTDPGKRARFGEQRKKNRRPHFFDLSEPRRARHVGR